MFHSSGGPIETPRLTRLTDRVKLALIGAYRPLHHVNAEYASALPRRSYDRYLTLPDCVNGRFQSFNQSINLSIISLSTTSHCHLAETRRVTTRVLAGGFQLCPNDSQPLTMGHFMLTVAFVPKLWSQNGSHIRPRSGLPQRSLGNIRYIYVHDSAGRLPSYTFSLLLTGPTLLIPYSHSPKDKSFNPTTCDITGSVQEPEQRTAHRVLL